MRFPTTTRVRDLNSRQERIGMVIGPVEHGAGGIRLLPVIVEGSTRTELWSLRRLEVLPKQRQLKPLGGRVKPLRGYPLVPPKEEPQP